jgi:hypothetical protein
MIVLAGRVCKGECALTPSLRPLNRGCRRRLRRVPGPFLRYRGPAVTGRRLRRVEECVTTDRGMNGLRNSAGHASFEKRRCLCFKV